MKYNLFLRLQVLIYPMNPYICFFSSCMQPRVLISLDELAYHEEHKKSLKNLREYQKKINESTLIKKWFEFDELIDQNIATIYQKWNKEIEKVKASFQENLELMQKRFSGLMKQTMEEFKLNPIIVKTISQIKNFDIESLTQNTQGVNLFVEEIKSRNEEDMKIKQDEFSDRIDMIGNMQAELKDILRNKSLTRSQEGEEEEKEEKKLQQYNSFISQIKFPEKKYEKDMFTFWNLLNSGFGKKFSVRKICDEISQEKNLTGIKINLQQLLSILILSNTKTDDVTLKKLSDSFRAHTRSLKSLELNLTGTLVVDSLALGNQLKLLKNLQVLKLYLKYTLLLVIGQQLDDTVRCLSILYRETQLLKLSHPRIPVIQINLNILAQLKLLISIILGNRFPRLRNQYTYGFHSEYSDTQIQSTSAFGQAIGSLINLNSLTIILSNTKIQNISELIESIQGLQQLKQLSLKFEQFIGKIMEFISNTYLPRKLQKEFTSTSELKKIGQMSQ